MPDKRTHRGPHPADKKLFAEDAISSLLEAIADFSLLLTKGYAEKSALKLVGDRFSLTERQRLAVMRSACSDEVELVVCNTSCESRRQPLIRRSVFVGWQAPSAESWVCSLTKGRCRERCL